MNMYAYVSADPVNARDPNGLQATELQVEDPDDEIPDRVPALGIARCYNCYIPGRRVEGRLDAAHLDRNFQLNMQDLAILLSGGSARAGVQLVSSSSESLPPFDLGSQFGAKGINAVGIPKTAGNGRGGTDHIDVRHGTGWTDTQAGRFFPQFTGTYNLSTKVLIPVLSSPTSVISPNTGGRAGFMVTGSLPYTIGETGSFRGLPSVATNRVTIIIQPVPILGNIGVYQVWTAFPSR